MPLERWFRLSQYLTLGLSCSALVFAETPFLPDLQICLAPVLALLLLAWWVEGRWSLPNWGANILGLLIAAAGVVWLVKQRSDNDFVLAQLPLHLALLPFMGPLSIAALLVKVFRLRDAGHFWHLQSLGLLQIGLGCLLDGGPVFGAMMMAYLASDLVCLALHYRLSVRRGARGQPSRDRKGAVETAPTPLPYGRGSAGPALFAFALRWTLLILATALLLFLLTPRRGNWNWEPLNKVRSGFNGGSNEEMNLNNSGQVELDDAAALRVAAVDAAGQPKLDLPADQRWRGSVLDLYEHGKWTTMRQRLSGARRRRYRELPDFGPDQFFLTFTVHPRQAGGLVLAEPIRFGPTEDTRLPVVTLAAEGRRRLFAELSGTVLPRTFDDLRGEYSYRQVMPAPGDPFRIAAEGISPQKDIPLLTTLPPPLHVPLQIWTADLLRRLSQHAGYRLPADIRSALANPRYLFRAEPVHWEAVARALTDYLAYSGEYTYTLDITRHNLSIDPVLDFLINIKQGHCERYAGALALMLRSVGIPARVVKGFRGCDNQGDGQYVVRHSHAHAWVEILAPHGETSFDWLTLDATPPEPPAPPRAISGSYLWDELQRFCLQWWRAMIVDYDGDEQADLWDMLTSGQLLSVALKLGLAALAAGIVFVAWLILRRLRRRRSTIRVRSDATIYSRLVRILGRYTSLRPSFGQTPREYGTAAQAFLQSRPTLAALADVPRRVVELFYRMRFGGRPLNDGERRQIDAELDRFAEKLRS